MREMFSRLGTRFLQRRERPLEHHGAAFLSGTGSRVDDVIGDGHHFRLVLDDMRLQVSYTNTMAGRTSKKSARVAKKAAKSRKAAPKSQSGKIAKPALLAGGNPQIAKADGDAPVQAYIAAMPGWKSDVGRRLDALIVRTVPGVRKAVKWNSPFYGVEGQGWFLGIHCFTKYVKVALFRGTSLRPVPPPASPSKRKCATSTSTTTTNSTKLNSPIG
jgi:hypothetical protein